MCGIIGIVGVLPVAPRLVESLKRLEYRGYDSAGVAGVTAPSRVEPRRAKGKIRDARIPYEIPAAADLPDRLDAVLATLYLIFNEGYSATFGDFVTRADLCAEAVRLARLVVELLPEPEATGLLAMMLLHDSRRAARTNDAGELIVLEEQDRARWNREQIREGQELTERALRARRAGPYAIQAAIAAVHADATSADDTDWAQIVAFYDLLLNMQSSPVVELNRAAAIAMRDGPARGLDLINALLARGELGNYHLAHSARADLLRRLGRTDDALAAYTIALALTTQHPERRYIERRMAAQKRLHAISQRPDGNNTASIMAFSDTREANEEATLFGTPDQICRKLEHLQAAGVEYILLNGGGTSRQNLRRFAKEVMPHFQTQASSRTAAAE